MAKRAKTILTNISAAELRRMLAIKEKLEKLESRRKTVAAELTKLDKEIEKILAGGAPAARRKKVVKKKAVKKKAGRRKVAKKKVAAKKAGARSGRKVAKKTVRKAAKKTVKAAAKKTGRKVAKKPARKKPARKRAAQGKGGATLEDVVIGVIKAAGKEMSFPDIRDTITSKKLYQSKSKNFDNVLRRTISTAKRIKRVGRGVYAVK
jgi:hypothetical protein